MNAPTLMHALGDRSGGSVRLIGPTSHTVSCEHPQEFLDALRFVTSDTWFEDDNGAMFRIGAMYTAAIVSAAAPVCDVESDCAQGMHEIVSWPQPGAIVRCRNCDAALTVGRVYPDFHA